MNENQMRSFIAAVEKGSFSKAAKGEYLSVPSFQQRINTLEGEIGYRILDRSPYGVKPTEAGEHLYTAMKQALSLLDEAKERGRVCAENGPAEKVCVGVWWQVPTFFKDVMEYLIPNHPNIWVDFVEVTPDVMVEGFSQHTFDLVFMTHSKRLDACGLHFIPLRSHGFHVGVSPQSPLANHEVITTAMLDTITVYAGSDGRDTVGLESCDAFYAQSNVVKKSIFFEKLLMDCLQGNAVCFTTEDTIDSFSPPLVTRPSDLPSVEWGIYARPDASDAVAVIIDACVAHFASGTGASEQDFECEPLR